MAAASLRIQQVGSSCGFEWDYLFIETLKEILISSDCNGITSIQFIYKQDGTNVLTAKHGGDGPEFATIQLSGPITMISGHYGFLYSRIQRNNFDVIKSLTFATKNATYGPFGTKYSGQCAGGTPFKFEHNGGIVGFHGRSNDKYLCALGVYIQTIAQSSLDSSKVVVVKKEQE